MTPVHPERAAFLLVVLALAATLQAEEVAGSAEAVHQRWIDAASVGLDPRAIEMLHRIQGANRRLLALRGYLRVGSAVAARWSWSQDRLTRYPATPDGMAAAADIDAVVAIFAKANPGYGLHADRQPRSLEVQLSHWNDNESVAVVSAALAQFLDRHFAGSADPPTADLRNALMHWTPSSAAALAAPGLSAHGQGRAFDFFVTRNGQIVAGLKAAAAHSRWDDAGWTRKLHTAVVSSGKPFVGPLQSPYEPWHYAYSPVLHGQD